MLLHLQLDVIWAAQSLSVNNFLSSEPSPVLFLLHLCPSDTGASSAYFGGGSLIPVMTLLVAFQ